MTEPEATDADRQEQQQLATPPVPELADEVAPLADDVPEADGIEQQLSAVPGSSGGFRGGAEKAGVLLRKETLRHFNEDEGGEAHGDEQGKQREALVPEHDAEDALVEPFDAAEKAFQSAIEPRAEAGGRRRVMTQVTRAHHRHEGE